MGFLVPSSLKTPTYFCSHRDGQSEEEGGLLEFSDGIEENRGLFGVSSLPTSSFVDDLFSSTSSSSSSLSNNKKHNIHIQGHLQNEDDSNERVSSKVG